MLSNVVWIVICHIVGDYLLQTDYMAREKGRDWYVLFAHCVCYVLPFILKFGMCWQIAVMFAVHIDVDACKARYHKIGIVTDQILHYAAALLLLV